MRRRRFRGFTGTRRSWRSSKARRRSTRRCLARSCFSGPAVKLIEAGSGPIMAIDPPTHASAADLALIGGFNQTAAPFPRDVTLQQLIEAEVERHPERTAVVCEHDRFFGTASLTYGDLNDKVNALAHRLRAEG